MNLDALLSGLPLALTGMTVVFLALGAVSLFITALPRLLGLLERVFPEAMQEHGEATVTLATSSGGPSPAAVAAAVAAIIHQADGPARKA